MNFCNNIFKNLGSSIAIITLTKKFTYQEINELSNKAANWLTNLGFLKNDIIVAQGDNSIEMIIIWLATVKSGGTTLFVSNEHSQNSIDNITEQIKVFKFLNQENINNFLLEIFPFDDKFKTIDVDKSDTCVLTLSSGTTGEYQKIIKHSHEHTIFAITTGSEFAGVPTPTDTIYGTASLNFSFGIAYSLCVALYYGASSIMSKKLSLIETLKVIKEYNVTMFFSAPVFYRMILQLDIKDYFKAVKLCFSGGDYLPTSLRKEWVTKTNKYLTNIIGTAESQYFFACSKEGVSPDDSIGRILPGYLIKSENDEMLVNDHLVSFKTNDKIEIINDYLYYYGRSDDLLHTTFGKYNPSIIEFNIMDSGLVQDVFATQYYKMGISFIQIFCIKKMDDTTEEHTKKLINNYCNNNLDKHLRPKKITFVKMLSRTVTGKPKRKELKGIK